MSTLMQSVTESLSVYDQWPTWQQRAADEFIADILQSPWTTSDESIEQVPCIFTTDNNDCSS